MITIVKYSSKHKKEWDNFVMKSKNGVFFFLRDYIEYHSNRFTDYSLMFYDDKKLKSVLPANINKNILFSHEGLSFGGVVLDSKITIMSAINIFTEFLKFTKQEGITKIIYKCIPYIYHTHPAQEDLYSLYQTNAILIKRSPSSVIRMKNRSEFQTLRKRGIKKGIQNELIIKQTQDYKTFWNIVTKNLMDRHKVMATHSLAEIEYLRTKFSKYIQLFTSFKDEEMIAGVVMYESKTVVRAQYIATIPKGRDIGALDIIFDYLINTVYTDKDYFDLGISTETYLMNDKLVLNKGLVFQKEGFGGRSVMYDTYEINL